MTANKVQQQPKPQTGNTNNAGSAGGSGSSGGGRPGGTSSQQTGAAGSPFQTNNPSSYQDLTQFSPLPRQKSGNSPLYGSSQNRTGSSGKPEQRSDKTSGSEDTRSENKDRPEQREDKTATDTDKKDKETDTENSDKKDTEPEAPKEPSAVEKATKAFEDAKQKFNDVYSKLSSDVKNLIKNVENGLVRFANGNLVSGLISKLGQFAQKLNYSQGNKIAGYDGTCGLVSTQNIFNALQQLRGSNNFISERDVVGNAINRGTCSPGGGTTRSDWEKNFKQLGIYGGSGELTTDQMAKKLDEGRALEIAVNSSTIYNGYSNGQQWQDGPWPDHAVSLMGYRQGKNGEREFAYVDSSGMYRSKGLQWVPESLLRASIGQYTDAVWSTRP